MHLDYDIEPLILFEGDRVSVRKHLHDENYFDSRVMHHHDEALRVWRSITHMYANKEAQLEIPFSLAENPKLYALDALCIADSLIENKDDLTTISKLFTVFYLMTHFFDDHVEHQDKFFSKFDFSSQFNINTQYGAAPFSFMLISFSIIDQILQEAHALSDKSKRAIQSAMYDRLAIQTRHFASERRSNLNVDEVLEMKARHVNGQTLGVLADILREFKNYSKTEFSKLEKGLYYLGSLEQLTDDIRDIAIDTALRNANIINSASQFGFKVGAKKVSQIYKQETKNAAKYLSELFSKDELSKIFSLPFYPFMIDKSELEKAKQR